jgi:starvation-inducible DNA-binding protein
MLARQIDAHETVIERIRTAIDKTEASRDWGTNDLLMSDALRRNELQVWFVSAHLVDVPLEAHDGTEAGATSNRR